MFTISDGKKEITVQRVYPDIVETLVDDFGVSMEDAMNAEGWCDCNGCIWDVYEGDGFTITVDEYDED